MVSPTLEQCWMEFGQQLFSRISRSMLFLVVFPETHNMLRPCLWCVHGYYAYTVLCWLCIIAHCVSRHPGVHIIAHRVILLSGVHYLLDMYFTDNLWAHDTNLAQIKVALSREIIIQAIHIFAYATTAELSGMVMCQIMTWFHNWNQN